ncbi:MAG: helix-turn-helix domain-containing protein [Tyzzerella sp.]|nr:helix-turn-helix domain-containing protein [Tyzzerella sp.]
MQNVKMFSLKKIVKQEKDKLAIFFYKQRDVIIHKHDCFELAYITEGNATQTLAGKTEYVEKGAYFIIDQDSLHQYTNCQNLELINCLFLGEVIDASLATCTSFDELMRVCMIRFYKQYLGLTAVNRVFYDTDGRVLKILKEIIEEDSNRDFGYQELFRGKLLEILILMMRTVLKQHSEIPIEKITDSAIIRDAVHYLETHYQDKAILHNFCKKHHYDSAYISRRFKKETGLTVLEYLKKIRIEKACGMLAGSKLTIREISQTIGYDDLAYFNQLFKTSVGMTPSEYRKQSNL